MVLGSRPSASGTAQTPVPARGHLSLSRANRRRRKKRALAVATPGASHVRRAADDVRRPLDQRTAGEQRVPARGMKSRLKVSHLGRKRVVSPGMPSGYRLTFFKYPNGFGSCILLGTTSHRGLDDLVKKIIATAIDDTPPRPRPEFASDNARVGGLKEKLTSADSTRLFTVRAEERRWIVGAVNTQAGNCSGTPAG